MQDEKSKRTRSPAYPYIDLEEAVAKVAVLWKHANRHSVPIDVAAKYWGYDGKSSVTYSVASALLKFGLVTDEGTGEQRQLKLSGSAIKLVYEPDTTDPDYIKELRDAALRPKIHSEIWENYGGKLPDDAVIKRYLVVERKFNDQYVDVFISEFRRTIEFAKLTDAVKVSKESTNEGLQGSKKGSQEQLTPPPSRIGQKTATQDQSVEQSNKNVLAQFSIPLGDSEATLTFTGTHLAPHDFDALKSYVELFKKQYERKEESRLQPITGTIASEPKTTGPRITFLFALEHGPIISCLSGAGTQFIPAQFNIGQQLTLVGEHKRDFTLGETPYFVFNQFISLKSKV